MTTFNTIETTDEMLNNRLYYDETMEEKYTYG